ncbi:MAG: protein kinase [Desulfatitalea sp.]|nr:protein kinase [Desulfatitalea sp.]NNK02418.1 protein kinase [Desulfatitalea sp.]
MPTQGQVFTDTSNFTAIKPEDIICVGGKCYLVKGEEREYRFGIEDPKFWVKKVIDVQTQERKIIKLAYTEAFMTSLGGVKIRCFRNPAKESDILELVDGHLAFMQGITYPDTQGNPVRILDIVRGVNFLNYIDRIQLPHDKYFWTALPDVLRHLIEAFRAIDFLHDNGFRHGDIRNDHVIVTHGNGHYVWIDFDYDFELWENPYALDLFGLGNLLIYAIGKGFHDYYMIKTDRHTYKDLVSRLTQEDFSLLHKSRLVNLRKIFPYIPPMLNNILLHFSRGAHVFYESVQEIIEDLNGYLESI